MCIRDMIDQFEIQGAFCIKLIENDGWTCEVIAEGHDFECEYYDISDDVLGREINYMYALDGRINIEVK